MSTAQRDPQPTACSPPSSTLRALVLCKEGMGAIERNLPRLLDAFGVPWSVMAVGELAAGALPGLEFCLLSSARVMAEALRTSGAASGTAPAWLTRAHSVYLYGFDDTAACRELLRRLSGDPQAEVRRVELPCSLSVTGSMPEFCGPLSGLGFAMEGGDQEVVFRVAPAGDSFRGIITTSQGELFFRVSFGGVPFYVSSSSKIIDLSERATSYFDVKKRACSSLLPTLYAKWAFRDICWSAPETSACLIIDDPPLTRRYGHLDFPQLLARMQEHDFVTTIAFIPWNWRRADPAMATWYRQHADRISLCVHGCDHTGGEFASRSISLLNRRVKTANERMGWLQERDAVSYDPVMVFPQGAFSPESGLALKLNGYIAAVNTEVAPSHGAPNETTIADLWSTAIRRYGHFPLFSRRYLEHGLENFAFDALLGKPCFIVGHHEVFREGGRALLDLIAALNGLHWKLRWRTLGAAVRHSHTARNHGAEIRMFAEEAVFHNPSLEARELSVFKDESEPERVESVRVAGANAIFQHEAQGLRFRVTIPPQESTSARVIYRDDLEMERRDDGLLYKIKVGARRYLSEFRDNYVSQSEFLSNSAARLRRALKR